MSLPAPGALQPMAQAMRLTDEMSWEKRGYFDVTRPHGFVTYRISRDREAE